jgi:hypothetical protein
MHTLAKHTRDVAVALTIGLGAFAGGSLGAACLGALGPGGGSSGGVGAFVLQPRYTVLTIDSKTLPLVTVAANGDSIRVYADTLYINLTDSTYIEATRVGRFAGFTAESIKVERLTGQKVARIVNGVGMFDLPVLIGGRGNGSPQATTELWIRVSRTGASAIPVWRYIPH